MDTAAAVILPMFPLRNAWDKRRWLLICKNEHCYNVISTIRSSCSGVCLKCSCEFKKKSVFIQPYKELTINEISDGVIRIERLPGARIKIKKCKTPECLREIRIYGNSYSSGYCRRCLPRKRRVRPYESLYRKVVKCNGGKEDILKYEEFVEICNTTNNCYYCSNPVHRKMYPDSKKDMPYYLDRLNPFKGYSIDNIVTCCTYCNFLKGNLLSPEETLSIMKFRKIKEYY